MKKQNKKKYITIPHQGVKPQWVEGVSTEELLAAHGTNVGALGTVEVSYGLNTIVEELSSQGLSSGAYPVLLVAKDIEIAKTVVRAARDTNLDVRCAYTKDRAAKAPQSGICIGDEFSEGLFDNSYAVLQAAEECDARAILLIDSKLSYDQGFLGLTGARELHVFRSLSSAQPQNAWILCVAHAFNQDVAWKKCPHCGLLFEVHGLAANHFVCPTCDGYFRMSSLQRIDDLLDEDSFKEWDAAMATPDPLEFPGYPEKIATIREQTDLDEAVRCGEGSIAGVHLALCIMDSQFFMGSMGSVVGEKITRAIERATAQELPLVIFTASGGARMQEGLISLMQMAKISCALAQHAEANLFYLSVLTDPTTGGVTASFATQGDIVLAEPKALIGFAGQRVIQDTIKQSLPDGFQTAEFALEHGIIDAVVQRKDLREKIAHLLAIHEATSGRRMMANGESVSYAVICENLRDTSGPFSTAASSALPQIRRAFVSASRKVKPAWPWSSRSSNQVPFYRLSKQKKSEKRLQDLLSGRSYDEENTPSVGDAISTSIIENESSIRSKVSTEQGAHSFSGEPKGYVANGQKITAEDNPAWESVMLVRNTKRPTAQHYINSCVDGFIELHGDRSFGDDGAIVCGLGWIGRQPVTVIAQEKGSDLKERLARNFGCPQPEGYRKSLRIMKLAEKFDRPIVCLVDTQGAFCGTEAEERGQGNAIAENLINLASLKVPVISVLLGEGGSGGALALALADRVAMQRYAVYSILSPEGFASILWKDKTRAPEAAAVMKMSAPDAFEMGIVDAVLSEGDNPAHLNPEVAAACVRSYLVRSLEEVCELPLSQLLEERYERFRKY